MSSHTRKSAVCMDGAQRVLLVQNCPDDVVGNDPTTSVFKNDDSVGDPKLTTKTCTTMHLSLSVFSPTRIGHCLKIMDPTVPNANGRTAAFPHGNTHAHSHTHTHTHTRAVFSPWRYPRQSPSPGPNAGQSCSGRARDWCGFRHWAVRRAGGETMVHLFIPITFSSLLLLLFTLFGVNCLGGSVVGDSPWRVYVLAQASQSSAFLWSNGGSGANDNGGTTPLANFDVSSDGTNCRRKSGLVR
jgi:hypothetical protein